MCINAIAVAEQYHFVLSAILTITKTDMKHANVSLLSASGRNERSEDEQTKQGLSNRS